MTINEYQKECVNIMPKDLYRGEQALMSIMKISYDSGCLMNTYKQVLYNERPLNREDMCYWLSCLASDIAICADAFDYDLETAMACNLNKSAGKE